MKKVQRITFTLVILSSAAAIMFNPNTLHAQQACGKVPSFAGVNVPNYQRSIINEIIQDELKKRGMLSAREREAYQTKRPSIGDATGWTCTVSQEFSAAELASYATTIISPGVERAPTQSEWTTRTVLGLGGPDDPNNNWRPGGGICLNRSCPPPPPPLPATKFYSQDPTYNYQVGHLKPFPVCIAERRYVEQNTGEVPVYIDFNIEHVKPNTQWFLDTYRSVSLMQIPKFYRSFPSSVWGSFIKDNGKVFYNDRIKFSGFINDIKLNDACQLSISFEAVSLELDKSK